MAKVRSKPMEIVSKTVPLSARVQKKLELIAEGRYQKKRHWAEELTVLDEETAKLPLIKRNALAIKKVLSEIRVEIREHDLLAGSISSGHPFRSALLLPEYATQEEKEAAAKRLTTVERVEDDDTPYYPRYLKLGLGGLRKIAEEKLDKSRQKGTAPEKEAWYESVIMSLDGLKEFIRRHSDLASELADSETNPMRKGELHEIAKISQHLLQGPPQTFREALQAVWFAQIAFRSTLTVASFGRFDQNLWPYLKRDLENGTITINEAQELVDSLWLKLNEQLEAFQIQEGAIDSVRANRTVSKPHIVGGIFLGGKTTRDRLTLGESARDGGSSQQFDQTLTLSGLTPEGLDGTNPLTYLCLNATFRLKTSQPCLYVRFHDGSPPKLYERVADCIRAGCIGPTIFNDEVIVTSLTKIGIPVEHARDYTSDGCWEVHIQGRTDNQYVWVSVAEDLDRVLNPAPWEEVEVPLYIEAMDPFRDFKAPDPYSFHSFDEVMESFKGNLDKHIKSLIEAVERSVDGRLYKISPRPFFSAFVEGPLESGKDMTQGGIEYCFRSPYLIGLSHAADSLAVIKKLCFEEKTIEWSELLDAIRNNWQGKEYLRQLVRTRAPAYGNDVDYVDDIATEIVEYFVESIRKHSAKVLSNVKYTAGGGTFQLYTVLGRPVGATPDGRLAGEPLSTNASPSIGRPVNGQTAALNSYVKQPLVDLPGGSIIDINIDAKANLLLQLEPFIKSFVDKRGNVINIAVNDCEKLRAAQREPEKYRDLKVRVGGYDAYFVDLPPRHQELQIQRCEQYA